MDNPFTQLIHVLERVIERARVVRGATPKIKLKVVRKCRLIYVNHYQLRITKNTVDLWALGNDSIYRVYHPTLQESLELMTVVATYKLVTEKQLERALEFLALCHSSRALFGSMYKVSIW